MSSTRLNHYPSPSTGARKVIGLSFPRGGEGGNEDYQPLVCRCCYDYAPGLKIIIYLKRAGMVSSAQL